MSQLPILHARVLDQNPSIRVLGLTLCYDTAKTDDCHSFMLRKLYSLVSGATGADNPDSPQHHEVLLPGFLYGMIIKERFEECLGAVKAQVNLDIRQGKVKDFHSREYTYRNHHTNRHTNDNDDATHPRAVSFVLCPANISVTIARYFQSVLAKTNWDIGQKLSYFLATGNLVSPTGLDLQQTSGFTIVAEKLNFYRYLSHFRCIHRGAFFAELKTTTVRKLLPESWGGCLNQQ